MVFFERQIKMLKTAIDEVGFFSYVMVKLIQETLNILTRKVSESVNVK